MYIFYMCERKWVVDRRNSREEMRLLWVNIYNGRAMQKMNTPTQMLGEHVSKLFFVMPPLMLGKKPILAKVGKVFLRPMSASAAAKSIEVAASTTNDISLIKALTAKRRVYVGSTGAKSYTLNGSEPVYVEKKSRYSRIGSSKMDKEGFVEVGECGDDCMVVMMEMFNKICDECMYAIHSILHEVKGISYGDGGYSYGVEQAAYGIAMKYIGLHMIVRTDEQLTDSDLFALCMDPYTHSDKLYNFYNNLKITPPHIVGGKDSLLFAYTGGVTTPMPSDKGWGYMTPICSSKQRALRGENANSISRVVYDCFRENAVELHARIVSACSSCNYLVSVYDKPSGMDPTYINNIVEVCEWMYNVVDEYVRATLGACMDEFVDMIVPNNDMERDAYIAEQVNMYNAMMGLYSVKDFEAQASTLLQHKNYNITRYDSVYNGVLMKSYINSATQ